jgi:thymidylate synthase
MKRYKAYHEAENDLIIKIVTAPQFITKTTYEILGTGFILEKPWLNRNDRSNYEYAEQFFGWMMTGEKQLSTQLLEINPWVKRFVDTTGLPESFSSTYGWKIKEQMEGLITELKLNSETRRAYLNILRPEDKIILGVKTTMEYPCTIGVQFFIRDQKLVMLVNMRSNNVYSVMPYDVYNFTELQGYVADMTGLEMGIYIHQINNAHMYKGDVRRVKELMYAKSK